MKKSERTHDVCAGECERILYGSVHMALCCQMDDSVDIVCGEDFRDMRMVADVSLHEDIVRTILNVLKVLKVACIGQRIEVYDPIIRIFRHEETNHMTAYETGSARYQNISFEFSHSFENHLIRERYS